MIGPREDWLARTGGRWRVLVGAAVDARHHPGAGASAAGDRPDAVGDAAGARPTGAGAGADSADRPGDADTGAAPDLRRDQPHRERQLPARLAGRRRAGDPRSADHRRAAGDRRRRPAHHRAVVRAGASGAPDGRRRQPGHGPFRPARPPGAHRPPADLRDAGGDGAGAEFPGDRPAGGRSLPRLLGTQRRADRLRLPDHRPRPRGQRRRQPRAHRPVFRAGALRGPRPGGYAARAPRAGRARGAGPAGSALVGGRGGVDPHLHHRLRLCRRWSRPRSGALRARQRPGRRRWPLPGALHRPRAAPGRLSLLGPPADARRGVAAALAGRRRSLADGRAALAAGGADQPATAAPLRLVSARDTRADRRLAQPGGRSGDRRRGGGRTRLLHPDDGRGVATGRRGGDAGPGRAAAGHAPGDAGRADDRLAPPPPRLGAGRRAARSGLPGARRRPAAGAQHGLHPPRPCLRLLRRRPAPGDAWRRLRV